MAAKPKLAVWKFASCDGCQLSLLDLEDELLALAGAVEIAYFLEATRATVAGPYDLSLVEGSITTPHDAERIQQVRAQSKALVTIGACATAGGIQALRNFADVKDFIAAVYARPDYIETLATSTAISDHVAVDFELRGCPVNKRQLLEVVTAFTFGRKPAIAEPFGVPGMQDARQCLRGGGPWHALPGAGDAGRLRRDLSGLQSRLLWLLRPAGHARHGGNEQGSGRPWHDGARHPALPAQLQCRCAGLPGRERAP